MVRPCRAFRPLDLDCRSAAWPVRQAGACPIAAAQPAAAGLLGLGYPRPSCWSGS